MTLSWEGLLRRAGNGDQRGVTTLLLAATEAERVAFGPVLVAGVKRLKQDDWWGPPTSPAAGLALAVVATQPSAATAAALLTRRDMHDGWGSVAVDRLLEIVAARGLTWLGDLGTRLAHRLPAREVWDTGDWRFVAAVLAATGTEPPVTEGFVRGWLQELLWPGRRAAPLVDRLRRDPHLDLMLPALFEVDGLGAEMTGSDLPGALAALAAEGRLERKAVLAATLDRLLRGDRSTALRPFVFLHDTLAPTVDEMAGHTLGYARLLAEAPGPVATLAQRALRAVDDAGLLPLETLLEAAGPALLRPEKTLVKAQLTWLAARRAGRADEVCETIAVAFGHPALDVQERALNLVVKALPGLAPETVARLASAGAALGGDLTARAAGLFGVTAADAVVAALAPAAPVAPMPPPITDTAELAEELAALVEQQSAVGWERVLAAVVALHASGSLTDAVLPVLDRHPAHFSWSHWNAGSPSLGVAVALRSVLREGLSTRLAHAVDLVRQGGRRDWPFAATPAGVLGLRAAEVAANLAGSAVPMLVATPTHVNGSLDGAVLADRLARAEAEGWEPWHFDLEQALLRVPRDTDPTVADHLTSPAGRRFAAWLTGGGLPDPVSERFEQSGASGPAWQPPLPRRVVAALRPARDDGLLLERELLTLSPSGSRYAPDDHAQVEDVLAMVLPHHREVTAAWALPELAALAEDQRGTGRLLPLLADCHGPVGTAFATGLAYGLGAKDGTDRAAAVDAFLILAARPEPFAGAVGAALADLGADGTVKLSRVAPALGDAHRAGATAAVGELLATALPGLLTTGVRAVPDLLEVATQVAVTRGTVAPVAGLAEVAARPGGSRLVREARRLHITIEGGAR